MIPDDDPIRYYFYENVIAREAVRCEGLVTSEGTGYATFEGRPDWKMLFAECSCGHRISALREDNRVYCLACVKEIVT